MTGPRLAGAASRKGNGADDVGGIVSTGGKGVCGSSFGGCLGGGNKGTNGEAPKKLPGTVPREVFGFVRTGLSAAVFAVGELSLLS